MTFVNETKGISSNSDNESYSEYETPQPDPRPSNVASAFSTPTNDAFVEPQHSPIFAGSKSTDHVPVDRSESPSAIPSLTTSFNHKHWESRLEQRTDSNPPEQGSLLLPSSPNPLTIEGILNKGGAVPFHQELHQAYEHGKESPPIPPIYSDKPVWPLADPAEAKLLRHFIQKLAIWVRGIILSEVWGIDV